MNEKPDFWLAQATAERVVPGSAPRASRPDAGPVDAFHAVAIAAGAIDDGAPGLRPLYDPTYYGAFVLDPHGIYLEACKHKPE